MIRYLQIELYCLFDFESYFVATSERLVALVLNIFLIPASVVATSAKIGGYSDGK